MTGNLSTIVSKIVTAAREAADDIDITSSNRNLTPERVAALKVLSKNIHEKANQAKANDPKAISFLCDVLDLDQFKREYDVARRDTHVSTCEAYQFHKQFLADRKQALFLGVIVGLLMFLALAPFDFTGMAPLLQKGMGAIFSGETFVYMTCALMLAWGISPFSKYIRKRIIEIYDSVVFGLAFLATISLSTGLAYVLFFDRDANITQTFKEIFSSLIVILVAFLITGPFARHVFRSLWKDDINKFVFAGLFWASAVLLAFMA